MATIADLPATTTKQELVDAASTLPYSQRIHAVAQWASKNGASSLPPHFDETFSKSARAVSMRACFRGWVTAWHVRVVVYVAGDGGGAARARGVGRSGRGKGGRDGTVCGGANKALAQ